MPNSTDRRRLAAQRLIAAPAGSPREVVEHLFAIQAQDLRGARLALRPRARGLSASDIDKALTLERSLVISWLNRGTLHLVTPQDYWLLHSLTTPQLATGNARRLREEGVSAAAADRGVAVVVETLTDLGRATRGELRERLTSAGVPVAGQALVHVLVLATLRGLVVRGPMVGSEQAFVLTEAWLGPPPQQPDREEALALVARRYLAGHGPATEGDLARWAGLPLTAARTGLAALADEVEVLAEGLVDLPGRPADPALPPPLLLGPYDPLLHGWVSREPVLGSHREIVTSNGLFRPFALVEGVAAGTWRLPGGRVVLKPFGRLPRQVRIALDAEAADVERFLSG